MINIITWYVGRQTTIWIHSGLLLTRSMKTKCNEGSIRVRPFSHKKMAAIFISVSMCSDRCCSGAAADAHVTVCQPGGIHPMLPDLSSYMKTEKCIDANIVVIGGTTDFHYGTSWCLQWRHNWHYKKSPSSVIGHMLLLNTMHIAMETPLCLHSVWHSRCAVVLGYTFAVTDVVRYL